MCVKHIFIYLYPNPANLETTISIFTLLFQIYIYIYFFFVDKSSKFYSKMKRNYSVFTMISIKHLEEVQANQKEDLREN